jgi:hypothetical protein
MAYDTALVKNMIGLGFTPWQATLLGTALAPASGVGPVTWSYDGTQQITGNTDVSLMEIGSYALPSGTFNTLLTGSDFAHLYFCHNGIVNSKGNVTNTYDYTSTSYVAMFTDAGLFNIYEAPATGVAGAAPSFAATPTFSLNMISGALAVPSISVTSIAASSVRCIPAATTPASPALGMIAAVNTATTPTLGAALSLGAAAYALAQYGASGWTVIGI